MFSILFRRRIDRNAYVRRPRRSLADRLARLVFSPASPVFSRFVRYGDEWARSESSGGGADRTALRGIAARIGVNTPARRRDRQRIGAFARHVHRWRPRNGGQHRAAAKPGVGAVKNACPSRIAAAIDAKRGFPPKQSGDSPPAIVAAAQWNEEGGVRRVRFQMPPPELKAAAPASRSA